MAADLIGNYRDEEAFQFIRDVGVDWEQSKVLDGEIGDYVVIAREERETMDWFVGGITDENARQVTITFDFLEEDMVYEATLYKDGQDAHYRDNPTSYAIEQSEIRKGDNLSIQMAAGGGFALSLLKK